MRPDKPSEVLQGAVSSEAHKLPHPDGGKISDHAELYLDERLRETAVQIHGAYSDAGANVFVTGTHTGTPHRFISNNGKQQLDVQQGLQLGDRHAKWNQVAAEVAREVAGDDRIVLGSVAPLMDTSGIDNAAWRSLGKDKQNWAYHRHKPQIEALLLAGTQGYDKGDPLVDGILVEAGLYAEEGLVLAALINKIRPDAGLILCHEFHGKKFPDPDHPRLTLDQLKAKIREQLPNARFAGVGLNCCAVEDIDHQIAQGQSIAAAYPNRMNYFKAGELRGEIEKLNWQMQQAASRGDSFAQWLKPLLDEKLDNDDKEFEDGARRQVRANVDLIGGCCGTGPEQTKIFRRVWDEENA